MATGEEEVNDIGDEIEDFNRGQDSANTVGASLYGNSLIRKILDSRNDQREVETIAKFIAKFIRCCCCIYFVAFGYFMLLLFAFNLHFFISSILLGSFPTSNVAVYRLSITIFGHFGNKVPLVYPKCHL